MQTYNVLGQDVCKIRTEASPQQHVAALSGHASSHNWGIPAYRPSVPRYVAGGLDQLVEQGFVEHKTSAGQRNVSKNCENRRAAIINRLHNTPIVLLISTTSVQLSRCTEKDPLLLYKKKWIGEAE